MANQFKIRYLSNREKLPPLNRLHKDRHLYLGLNEAEPNLGYINEKPLPTGISTFYSLVTIENGSLYDRYWKEVGLRIQDEGQQVGVGNDVNIVNFTGAAIEVLLTSQNSVDVKVFAPGLDNQIIYNNDNEFTGAQDFYYDSDTNRIGIGTANPQYKLDLIGNLRISDNIYDSKNVVGIAGSVLVSTSGNGVIWGRGAPVSIGTIPHTEAVAGELWWNSNSGNLKVYYNDGDSEQWVDASSGMGIQGLQGSPGIEPTDWSNSELGITTSKNVGIGTTIPYSNFTVIGDAFFTGIVTALGGFVNVENNPPVIIEIISNKLIFNVVGIGSTSLFLY